MRQRVITWISITLTAAMVVSMIASLAYGLHLRAVSSPYPDPSTGQTVRAIYLQNRRATADLYITQEQWKVLWILFAPALTVWLLCGLLVVVALVQRMTKGKV